MQFLGFNQILAPHFALQNANSIGALTSEFFDEHLFFLPLFLHGKD